jgi:hypothetical protein
LLASGLGSCLGRFRPYVGKSPLILNPNRLLSRLQRSARTWDRGQDRRPLAHQTDDVRCAQTMRDRESTFVAMLAASLLLVSASAADTPAASADAGRCQPSGSHTLLSERTLRVYRTHNYGHGESTSDLVIACWRASGRQTVLVTESPRDPNNEVRLTAVTAAPGSASVIAAASSTVGVGLAGTDLLQAFNVHTGHRLNSNEAELLSCEEGCNVSVFGFVVAPSGSLAFLGEVSAASTDRPVGLYTKAVGGSIRLLELGAPAQQPEPGVPTIAGLSFANGVLSWTSNGSAKSSPWS